MRPVPIAKLLLLLSALALLCATPVLAWAAPTIEGYRLDHVTLLRSGGVSPRYAYVIGVRFGSVSERESITGLSVEPPGGETQPLAFWPTCGGPGTETALCSYSESAEPPAIPAGGGTYTITVQAGSEATTFVAGPVTHFPEPVPTITYPIPGQVFDPTQPFRWEPYAGFTCEGPTPLPAAWQFASVEPLDESARLWSCELAPEPTEIPYGAGTESPPPLEPGQSYLFKLQQLGPDLPLDPIGNGPPGVFREETRADSAFVIYSPLPVIESLWVGRGRDTSPEGTVSYHERMIARVSDVDDDITSVVITDSQGNPHDAYFQSDLGDWRWEVYWEENPSPAGAYTLTVTDSQGYRATLSVQTSEIPDTTAAIVTPPANYSVATGTPTFSWFGPRETCYCLGVYEVDGPCAIWCGGRYVAGSEGVALYNDNGGAAQAELTPGHLYGWYATAMLPDPAEQSGPQCVSEFNPIASGGFWVEPKFVGFLEPIDDDGSSVFRRGSTIPVKFQLLAADGSQVTDATCELEVTNLTAGTTRAHRRRVGARAPDGDNGFHYLGDHYQLNLDTSTLSPGTYRLHVTVDRVPTHETTISLR
jgi:hypothetical protein